MNAGDIVLIIVLAILGLLCLFFAFRPSKEKREAKKKREQAKILELQQKEKLDQVNMYTIALVVPIEIINQHGKDNLLNPNQYDLRYMITRFGYKTFDQPTPMQIRTAKAKGEPIDFDFLITKEMEIYDAKTDYFKELYHTVLEQDIMGMMLYYHNCFKADLTDLKK